jgi:hypothetical protein
MHPLIFHTTTDDRLHQILTTPASNRLFSSQPFPVLLPAIRATITFTVEVGANSYTLLHTGE